MKPAHRASRKASERARGAVLVEMAFTMPILALVFLVVIDVGFLVREHQILQNAAREGARYSALPQNQVSPGNPNATLANVKDFVVKYAQQEKITVNPANVQVNQAYTIPLSGGLSASGSEVTVTYTRPFLTIGRPILPLGSLQLTGRSVFRNLYGS